ncbi:AraC family transcriptional regulator [Frateuria defendens]|uniref:AraC family transcriptional regulator n=1 Tax=Frateuria defendens TaxID=2219559 RepID=UPI0009E36F79
MQHTWRLYEFGFASERQFQRAFRARYGISPAQWRRQCRHARGMAVPQGYAERSLTL